MKNNKNIKILSVSDVVEPRLEVPSGTRQFEGIDLIISCGDLPPEYLSFLIDSMKAPLYYVGGNHDIRYKAKPPTGGLNLHGRLIPFEGINIVGLEGSHWYNGGPYQYTEVQMRSIIRRLGPKLWWRGGIDVVVTHAPPRHIHDAEDPYFIHGHIHRTFDRPDDRITVVGKTKVVNTYGYNILEIENSHHAEPAGTHSTSGR
jgi:Icc-related predicted phosphoesterase